MKILLILALILTVSACKDAKSIGIIGGADGPTEIIVADKGETAMYQQITQEEAKKIMNLKMP